VEGRASRTALIDGNGSITYGELDEAVPARRLRLRPCGRQADRSWQS